MKESFLDLRRVFPFLWSPFHQHCPKDGLTPDQLAAHAFLTELRTRIATQPLPYQHGVEATALESLWKVFDQAREAIKKYPGCGRLSDRVTEILNLHVRPVTAKWHRAHQEGRLASRDGSDEFRVALVKLQRELRVFTNELHQTAYGKPCVDRITPAVMSRWTMLRCFRPLRFGIPTGALYYHAADLPAAAGQVRTPSEPAEATILRDKINQDEADEVALRRKRWQLNKAAGIDAVGVALSGGGIRAAAFSLGVTQVLAHRGLLKEVDFLSTVSGGGYTGSFLTRRLDAHGRESELAGPHGPDPLPIRYLRLHAKYLAARSLKQSWSMVAETLAGTLLNWTVPLFVALMAAAAVIGLRLHCDDVGSWWPTLLEITGGLAGLAVVGFAIGIRAGKKAATVSGIALAGSVGLTLAVAVGWLLYLGYGWFLQALNHPITVSTIAGMLTALVAAGPQVIRFVPVLREPAVRKTVLQVLLYVAGVVIPLLGVFSLYTFFHLGRLAMDQNWTWYELSAIPAALAFISIFLLNVNLTGPHRLYRNALAETFVQTTEADTSPVPLATVNSGSRAPYHLINATLNVPTSEAPALRERRSDFFVFSKKWCGAPVTGYQPTDNWRANGAPVDLATAMAISGAAVSANMGLGSMPTLRALLAFLNVRLGFWIRQPRPRALFRHPGFTCLLREMTGSCMSEKRAWLNLSDGGHIENMGAYELLRRRCKFILCVDGEADPDYTFGGLLTLARHAQIDFGIRFDPQLKPIRPDPQTGYSQTHAAFCRIRYPATCGFASGTGLLLYVKLSLTGNESALINRCRIDHPAFPHQATLDQFYDEEQFEAYRQLGVHVAEGLFSPALMTLPDGSIAEPDTFAAWFRALAANLLEPEPGA